MEILKKNDIKTFKLINKKKNKQKMIKRTNKEEKDKKNEMKFNY